MDKNLHTPQNRAESLYVLEKTKRSSRVLQSEYDALCGMTLLTIYYMI